MERNQSNDDDTPKLDPGDVVVPSDSRLSDENDLTELDKTIADSFPASDPPAQP